MAGLYVRYRDLNSNLVIYAFVCVKIKVKAALKHFPSQDNIHIVKSYYSAPVPYERKDIFSLKKKCSSIMIVLSFIILSIIFSETK